MSTSILFMFSHAKPNGLQLHEQRHRIDVASDEVSFNDLRKAERQFMNWFQTEFPSDYLLLWTARYADGKGAYSEYRAHLPAPSGGMRPKDPRR